MQDGGRALSEKSGDPQTTRTTRTAPGGVLGRLLAAAAEVPASAAAQSPAPREAAEPRPAADGLTPSEAELLAMSLTEFAKADAALLVRSALLGDDIVLASNEGAAARSRRGHVALLATELLQLYATGRLNVDALKVLHRSRKDLGDVRLLKIEHPRRPDGTAS